ncbi:type II toxin-antitoxin system VapB family antitoxin [Nocardia otitidiscaviarum]|uniref:Type II toxin-antitoxin system VapB family antitoxin n=1 Tax=Nocardia otitidiscaviarum TaxID=1823 RepID=A0A516NV53_9NOCA|nr:type II toxin-antitoxin system VapB family antitoxin [Nocardia otitidiscaviarum]MCP9622221.1 type II toxin-antitoxin system VapB family antitoxin [Nocardia otitidiscaviarum]QDP82787.1 type II toxin-antitoxin system VapB family antitoxin [Nocardia otitidiscaviarum]
MSRSAPHIDDTLLAEAAAILGTSELTATVNAALADVVGRRKREQFADWVQAGGLHRAHPEFDER